MIWFETNGTIWKVDFFENYARINFSTSSKDKNGEYHNSSWFANAVGKAFDFLHYVERGDFVHMKGRITNERYQDEYGNWINPKSPSLLIYDMYYFDESEGGNMDNPPQVVTENEATKKKSAKPAGRKTTNIRPPDEENEEDSYEDDELPF